MDHTPEFTQPQLPFNEIPYGYCHCGCGEKTRIAPKNHTKKGYVKGQPYRFVVGHIDKFRADRPLEDRFWERFTPGTPDECWLWRNPGAHKYGRVKGGRHTNGKYIIASRLSWEIHFGPIPDDTVVCHKCDTPACVNPSHLFLGTDTDNVADMDAKGRRGTYDHTATSPLTPEQVIEIRHCFAQGATKSALAKKYGVTWNTVYRIIERETWRHI